MKQLNNINKWFYLLAIGIITSWGLSGCNSNEIPSEFIPEKYLIIDEHEMNIGMASTFEVKVKVSSAWKLSSTADWCHFEQPLSYGISSAICTVDPNRGEEPRSCYIKVETFFKDNPIIDSILVVQEVNTLPILEINPNKDMIISSDGEMFDLDVTYNYGMKMKINYLKGDKWLSLAPGNLIEVDKNPVTERLTVKVMPNDIIDQRMAELIFISTRDQNVSDTIIVSQKPMIPLTPALTAFSDDFNTVTTQGALYTGAGWIFEANPSDRNITFKQFTNGMKALLIHGGGIQATAFGMMPAFNVKDMQNKKLSYKWAPGNNIAAETEKFEVVASTDYRDDPFKATWKVVEDVTNTENPTKIRPLSLKEVDLSSLANETRVYIAFRYTGSNSAYRFDDVKVGDVE